MAEFFILFKMFRPNVVQQLLLSKTFVVEKMFWSSYMSHSYTHVDTHTYTPEHTQAHTQTHTVDMYIYTHTHTRTYAPGQDTFMAARKKLRCGHSSNMSYLNNHTGINDTTQTARSDLNA